MLGRKGCLLLVVGGQTDTRERRGVIPTDVLFCRWFVYSKYNMDEIQVDPVRLKSTTDAVRRVNGDSNSVALDHFYLVYCLLALQRD
jgi:hypothetical protein